MEAPASGAVEFLSLRIMAAGGSGRIPPKRDDARRRVQRE